MKIVNDFLNRDHFWLKREATGEILGLQINEWGETELSDKFGDCEVIAEKVEKTRDLFGPLSLYPEEENLVLYI